MKILQYLEKAWIVAAACAFLVMLYNVIANRAFDNKAYFPLICCFLCLMLWNNLRSQRKFRDKMFGEKKEKQQEA